MKQQKTVDLSPVQIQELFNFTERIDITYKDVQCEIVDHLASGVEDYMHTNNESSFNVALYRYVESLPHDFFSDLTESKRISLAKYWQKCFFLILIKFLSIPRIIFSGILFMILYACYLEFGTKGIVFNLFFVLAFVSFAFIKQVSCLIHTSKKPEKYLFLTTYRYSVAAIIMAILYLTNLPYNYLLTPIFDGHAANPIYTCAVQTIYLLTIYSVLYIFPKYLNEEVETKYAHLNIQLT